MPVLPATRGQQDLAWVCDQLYKRLRCLVCGCTDDDCGRCIAKTGKPCAWVKPGLCSACAAEGRTLP